MPSADPRIYRQAAFSHHRVSRSKSEKVGFTSRRRCHGTLQRVELAPQELWPWIQGLVILYALHPQFDDQILPRLVAKRSVTLWYYMSSDLRLELVV
jgi:hypothetical protein